MKKIHIFKTDEKKIYSERMVDSIRWVANHFVSKTRIRETSDSVYYLLRHFDNHWLRTGIKRRGTIVAIPGEKI